MRIGVVVPAHKDWPTIRAFVLAAEDRGIDTVWMYDHLFHQEPTGERVGMAEAWTVVSAVAAVTSRVRIGTLVLCSPFRHPGVVAKMAASAQDVSDGRLILGIGAGWHDPEFEAFGFPTANRVAQFSEALPIVAGLLRGEKVSSDGRYYQVKNAELVPPPTHRVPLMVAAEGPRMLKLTAKHADSWVTAWYGAPDDRLRRQLSAMDEAAAGREPICKYVGIQVHDPRRSAEPELTFDELATTLAAYEALGVDEVIVQFLPHDEESLDLLVRSRNPSA